MDTRKTVKSNPEHSLLQDKLDVAEAEIKRLRSRTHQIQQAESARHASLESQVASWQRDMSLAKERVKDWRVDWTTDPPSQGEHGFWAYCSQNNKDDVLALVIEKQEALQKLSQLESKHAIQACELEYYRKREVSRIVEILSSNPEVSAAEIAAKLFHPLPFASTLLQIAREQKTNLSSK
jgi:hypothetical protein